jgi:chromosome segregation ATPase
MDLEARLRAISEEIEALKTEVRILDEQIDFQSDVAEDAHIRSVVSETPLADRESREASADLERMKKVRAELDARIASLRAEQDRLLERMLER